MRISDWSSDVCASDLEAPELALLFGPGSRAEVPLAGLVESVAGPQVIAGQVDRLLLEESTVWLIDYKSQRPAPTESADVPIVYLRQMAAYRALLARIYPGRVVRCFLLWTEGPRLKLGRAACGERVWE